MALQRTNYEETNVSGASRNKGPRVFFVKGGEETHVILLDEDPVEVVRHQLFLAKDKTAAAMRQTCQGMNPRENPEPCPRTCLACNGELRYPDLMGRRALFYSSLIEVRQFAFKGQQYQDMRMLLELDNKGVQLYRQNKKAYGKLTGALFKVYRTKGSKAQNSPRYGDHWQFIQHVDLVRHFWQSPAVSRIMEASTKRRDNPQARPLTHEEAVQQLIRPYNYDEVIGKYDPKEAEQFVAYVEAWKTRPGGQESQGYMPPPMPGSSMPGYAQPPGYGAPPGMPPGMPPQGMPPGSVPSFPYPGQAPAPPPPSYPQAPPQTGYAPPPPPPAPTGPPPGSFPTPTPQFAPAPGGWTPPSSSPPPGFVPGASQGMAPSPSPASPYASPPPPPGMTAPPGAPSFGGAPPAWAPPGAAPAAHGAPPWEGPNMLPPVSRPQGGPPMASVPQLQAPAPVGQPYMGQASLPTGYAPPPPPQGLPDPAGARPPVGAPPPPPPQMPGAPAGYMPPVPPVPGAVPPPPGAPTQQAPQAPAAGYNFGAPAQGWSRAAPGLAGQQVDPASFE